MKSPGIIYRRYRQLKRKILYDRFQEARKREHRNCVYGKMVEVMDKDKSYQIPICLYNQNVERGLEVCSQSWECNAFVNRFSKESIEKELNQELKDPYIRMTKYPELNVLEWILDKSLDDAKKEPTFLGRVAIHLIDLLENFIKSTVGDQKRLMDHI
jgi:hypothetical protein